MAVVALGPLLLALGCNAPSLTYAVTDCPGSLPATTPVDCAFHTVPRHHDDPHGPTLRLYVHHIAAAQARTGQIWLLSGGPGQAGTVWLYPKQEIDALRAAMPGLDIYVPDHRGSGSSAGLFCPALTAGENPNSEEYEKRCLANAQATQGNLDAFTATEAARDLEQLIAQERRGDEPVYVWGVSYGTYWAHRYLQVAPSQASAVIMESFTFANTDWTTYDSDANAEAQILFTACGADTFCSARLGSDPWTRLTQLAAKLDAGFCPSLGGGTSFRQLLGDVASLMPTWMPMVVYRADRCSADDQKVLARFQQALNGYSEEGFSGVLQTNIGLSEMWPKAGPSRAQAVAAESQLMVASGLVPYMAQMAPWWPVYPRDKYVGQWAAPTMPLLLMSGTLDFHTEENNMQRDAAHFAQAQHVILPNVGHGPSWDVPCARSLATAFLSNPAAPLDTSCIAGIAPPDFSIFSRDAHSWIGIDDAWEGALPPTR